jgi:class 3 adenylate cyclase
LVPFSDQQLRYTKDGYDMPIYMDRHQGEDLTPEAVAEAHAADLKIQQEYGCRFITYWFDEQRDAVFCLVDAPNMSAVRKVHEAAHGFGNNDIMEVDLDIVQAFLGKVEDPSSNADEAPSSSPFRAVMFTDLEGSTEMISIHGDEKSMELLRTHNALTRDALRAHAGREIKHTGDGFMTSFSSAVSAVECAIDIQQAMVEHNEENPSALMNLRIGICAGEPVQNDKQLYGAAVNLAARLCAHADPTSILVAQVVKDLCVGKMITFIDRGEVEVKGFEQPVPSYEVAWMDKREIP